MDSKKLFIEAVRAMASLPESLREYAGDVAELEEHSFDESYIDFLNTQIRLNPRGLELTARFTRRRAALSPFCGVVLLRGTVQAGEKSFTVEFDPKTLTVIHWEEYE